MWGWGGGVGAGNTELRGLRAEGPPAGWGPETGRLGKSGGRRVVEEGEGRRGLREEVEED